VCAQQSTIDAPHVTVVVTSSVEANQKSTPGVWYLSMLYWAEMWQQEQQATSTHDAQSSQQSQSDELKSCGLKDDDMRQSEGAVSLGSIDNVGEIVQRVVQKQFELTPKGRQHNLEFYVCKQHLVN
jgi:hypothetical protein